VKRFVLIVWLLTAGLGAMLAVDVAETYSQPTGARSPSIDLALVDALVVNTLETADESDALLRARGSAAVAQALAEAVQRAAKRADTAQAAKLKVWMTVVLDLGVRSNVDAVDGAALVGARKILWNDLNARPETITRAVETGLQNLNPPLKQALADADKKENERDKFKDWEKGWDKGKGPPRGKGPPPKGKGPPPPWGEDFKGWDKGKDKKGKKDQVWLAPLRTPVLLSSSRAQVIPAAPAFQTHDRPAA
jgi:hypothetical protein